MGFRYFWYFLVPGAVQQSIAQMGRLVRGWEVYGVMLRSVLLRGRAALYWAAIILQYIHCSVYKALYWAAIRGHSVWELLQHAAFNRLLPLLGKQRVLAEVST